MGDGDHPFAAIEQTFKKSVAAFDRAEVPFLLGGSLAIWAHGGPETRNDLDFMVKPEDAERALEALVDVGMRPDHPMGMTITDEVISRGPRRSVAAMEVAVMAVEDVLATKLLALGEHSLDLEGSLQLARALREQIDCAQVRSRTEQSPYARAFLYLVEQLGIVGAGRAAGDPSRRVRVVQ